MDEAPLLAGRYRLDAVIGRGGMAEVLRARDETLQRDVAIKLLHGHFTDDPAFQRRFRQEAQSAASLNHPNVVGVYDTGEQDGRPFIVMEIVEGRSLQEVIAHGGLTEDRALEVTADTCAALQYAHERGLVHRDVKPGNILLAEDGTVKVADFGIARAINADTVTQTAAILGTAAYLSPEQARGRQADTRSDIYALGVVLYELLTGDQPFRGDSAVTVAYQHVQELPTPPRELDATLSPAAEAVVMRAMAKNPANRYQDAASMRDDLLRALAGDRVAAPAVLRRDDTAALPPVDQTEVLRLGSDPTPPRGGSRLGRALGYVLLALLTVAAAAGAVLLLADQFAGEPVITARVPNVVGQSVADATTALSDAGFVLVVSDQVPSDEVPPGAVVRQEPGSGQSAPRDSEVQVVLSDGAELVTVPNVEGLELGDAREALRDANLIPAELETVPSDDIPALTVISTTPGAGAEVAPNSPVDLVVSGGPETVRVARVVGFAEADALFRLDGQGLQVQVVRVFDDRAARGVVVAQDPPADTELRVGETVTLEVSDGPAEPQPSPEPAPSPTVIVEPPVPPDPEPPASPEPTEAPSP